MGEPEGKRMSQTERSREETWKRGGNANTGGGGSHRKRKITEMQGEQKGQEKLTEGKGKEGKGREGRKEGESEGEGGQVGREGRGKKRRDLTSEGRGKPERRTGDSRGGGSRKTPRADIGAIT